MTTRYCPVCGANEESEPGPKYAKAHERANVKTCVHARRLELLYRRQRNREKRQEKHREEFNVQRGLEAGLSIEMAAALGGVSPDLVKEAINAAESEDEGDPDLLQRGRAWRQAIARYALGVAEKALEAKTPRYAVQMYEGGVKSNAWDSSTQESARARYNAYEQKLTERLEQGSNGGSN